LSFLASRSAKSCTIAPDSQRDAQALAHKEFELFFQPQIHSFQDRVTGFEALLRWHSESWAKFTQRFYWCCGREQNDFVDWCIGTNGGLLYITQDQ
jgi:predicted signal transduction protein with EAL and GGDEF domain